MCRSVILFKHCAGLQSYSIGLWTGHRYKEPILQAAHAMWSLGAAVSPSIIGRFLAELPSRNTATSSPVSDAANVVDEAITSTCIRSTGKNPREYPHKSCFRLESVTPKFYAFFLDKLMTNFCHITRLSTVNHHRVINCQKWSSFLALDVLLYFSLNLS